MQLRYTRPIKNINSNMADNYIFRFVFNIVAATPTAASVFVAAAPAATPAPGNYSSVCVDRIVFHYYNQTEYNSLTHTKFFY